VTKREVREYVLRIAASVIEAEAAGGWVHEEDSGRERCQKDVIRIENAIYELASSLRARADRLGKTK